MANRVSRRTLDEIKFRCDIVEVIGAEIELKRAGASFKACCPFHHEKTPSFFVNPQRQSYHCFGCGEKGDVFEFVQKRKGVDLATAVRQLALRAGVTVNFDDGDGEDDAAYRNKLYETLLGIETFYRKCLHQLNEAVEARRYLEKRRIGKDSIELFGIGYAPKPHDTILKWAAKHEVALPLLLETGSLVESRLENGATQYYDRFRGRITFPIRDSLGRTVGFSGRSLDPKARAKYVNSSETVVFKKSKILYAFHAARKAILDARRAIVCEGQIDVIRCHEYGFREAVASQGTAFTEDHGRMLNRCADHAILVFDTDRAGRAAAIKTARLLMGQGFSVSVATLENGADPDSFLLEHGAAEFKRRLEEAVSATVFEIELLAETENIRSALGASRVAKAITQTLLCVKDAVARARLLQEAAKRLSIPVSSLREEYEAAERTRQRASSFASAASTSTPEADTPQAGGATGNGEADTAIELALCELLLHAENPLPLIEELRLLAPDHFYRDACTLPYIRALEASVKREEALTDILKANASGIDPARMESFASAVAKMTDKMMGHEFDRMDALHDFMLRLWKRKLTSERNSLVVTGGGEPEAAMIARRAELTAKLHAVRRWSSGREAIESELEFGRSQTNRTDTAEPNG